MPEIPENLRKYIATRDKKLNKRWGYEKNFLTQTFTDLLQFGKVCVGGRASCGSKVDTSWLAYTMWNEVVKKANQVGYVIEQDYEKTENAWATINQGFWQAYNYTLKEGVQR